MSENWKRWEGQVVEHKYCLQSLVGSTDHSVVFLAEYRSPEPRQAAVKFLAADIPNADQVMVAWESAAKLSHPNLLRILQTGKCNIDDMELLYVAMEYAEENLAEIVPQRALMADETREALNAMVDVLVYLHGKDLTHGHICPANILAIGDQLKVSSDTIEPVADRREMTRERSAYDAPEIPATAYSPAADVWSLGVALVAMLTQQPPLLPFNENVDPVIPQSVREPFLEIARNALRRKAELRWTVVQIAERLNAAAVVAKAAAAGAAATATPTPVAPPVATAASNSVNAPSLAQLASATPAAAPPMSTTVSPLNVPLSKELAVPLTKQSRPPLPPVHVRAAGPKPSQRETLVLPNYAVPAFVAALILVSVIALPKILRQRTVATSTSTTASALPAIAKPTVDSGSSAAKRTESPTQQKTPPKAASSETAKDFTPPPARSVETPSASPAVMRSKDNSLAASARNSSDSPGRGEVLDQVMPEVTSKALSTISGTVRVSVRAHIDPAGNVSSAELDSAGPSRYFADKALQAAKHWEFSSPEVNGRSVASEWLIHFDYTKSGVHAVPQQTAP
jgi:TonB family protein